MQNGHQVAANNQYKPTNFGSELLPPTLNVAIYYYYSSSLSLSLEADTYFMVARTMEC